MRRRNWDRIAERAEEIIAAVLTCVAVLGLILLVWFLCGEVFALLGGAG